MFSIFLAGGIIMNKPVPSLFLKGNFKHPSDTIRSAMRQCLCVVVTIQLVFGDFPVM